MQQDQLEAQQVVKNIATMQINRASIDNTYTMAMDGLCVLFMIVLIGAIVALTINYLERH